MYDNNDEEIKCYKKFLYPTSFISFTTFIYAIYLELYLYSLIPLFVGLTSVIHWYNPKDDIYRKIDMLVVFISIIFIAFISYKHRIRFYYLIILFSILFYYISYNLVEKKYYNKAAFTHSLIHIFGNIGNIFLFWILYNIKYHI